MSADYVKWKDLDEVLDRHADGVVKRLRPELDSIDRRLDDGHEKFEKLEDDIQQMKLECVKRHALLRRQKVHEYGDVDEEDVEDDKDVKTIKRKTAAVVAIVTAVLTGAGVILLLVLTFLGKLPSP